MKIESRNVANFFNKDEEQMTKIIKNFLEKEERKFVGDNFELTSKTRGATGKEIRSYLMTEAGFQSLIASYSGEGMEEWQKKFTNLFVEHKGDIKEMMTHINDMTGTKVQAKNPQNELVSIQGKQITTTSLKVAEVFGKRHDHIIRDIEVLISEIKNLDKNKEKDLLNFEKSSYEDSYGRRQPMYNLTKDAFTLLTMGYTGKKALMWKLKYIEAFGTEKNKKETMNGLITITPEKIGNDSIETVNARELHNFLESKQKFIDWIKNRIEVYEFEENIDYTLLHKKKTQVTGAKHLIEYHISLNMAKELAMVERTRKGKEARRYFINAEKLLREGGGKKNIIDCSIVNLSNDFKHLITMYKAVKGDKKWAVKQASERIKEKYGVELIEEEKPRSIQDIERDKLEIVLRVFDYYNFQEDDKNQWLTRTQINRKSQKITAQERKKIIAKLLERGLIEMKKKDIIGKDGKKKTNQVFRKKATHQ